MDRGVDVYYGHSAHVFQGVEIYRGRPTILYDTGDFIDDYAVDPYLRNDRSLLFRVSMEGEDLRRLELFPVALSFARTGLAVGEEREETCSACNTCRPRWALPSPAAKAPWCSNAVRVPPPTSAVLRGSGRLSRGLTPPGTRARRGV